MTDLTLAAQRFLVQDPEFLTSGLIGVDSTWEDGWIFPDFPSGTIENTQKGSIVIWEDEPAQAPNPHNTAQFATLVVDIWMDPTRKGAKKTPQDDAPEKILEVAKIVRRHLHLVHNAVPAFAPDWWGEKGNTRIWGTAQEVQERTGIRIVESQMTSGPRWDSMKNNPKGWRGQYRFNVQYIA